MSPIPSMITPAGRRHNKIAITKTDDFAPASSMNPFQSPSPKSQLRPGKTASRVPRHQHRSNPHAFGDATIVTAVVVLALLLFVASGLELESTWINSLVALIMTAPFMSLSVGLLIIALTILLWRFASESVQAIRKHMSKKIQ